MLYVKESWIKAFQKNLLYAQEGTDLLNQLLASDLDIPSLIERVALASGLFGGAKQTKADHEHARRMKEFVAHARGVLRDLRERLDAVRAVRDGPVVVGSPEWPVAMDEFAQTLPGMTETLDALAQHYKPLAHGARGLNANEEFYVGVEGLRHMGLTDPQIVILLNAGYAVKNGEFLDAQALRDMMRSAKKLFGDGVEGGGKKRPRN